MINIPFTILTKALASLPQASKVFSRSVVWPPLELHTSDHNGLGKWKMINGVIYPIENVPIPVIYPKESNEGLWGGEGIVKGYRNLFKTRKHNTPLPRIWFPWLKNGVVYSEILDKYMEVVVTERTLQLIDENYGFDNYILKTPVNDLKSQLALDIRRKLLLTLVRKEMYPNDPEKAKEIYEKYKEHIIPEDQAEWHGLSLKDAISKQLKIEAEASKPTPKKHLYRQQLIEALKNKQIELIEEEKQKEEEASLTLMEKLKNPSSLLKKSK
ncbi:MRPL28 [Cordylochernes scorpioides]|uniref:Large ribosomal subunit protein bL28m n=1 Tax=Cordylochernes scorpioides TaxID=51811 RepID=A0ABY6KG15_9ARAC|nr:MRPL28 [Cordylochernes scorpioides]